MASLSTDKTPLLSVVIPVRNGASTILDQLRALADQRAPVNFEIIISDNGSADDLQSVLKEASQQWPSLAIRYIDSSAKRGVSYARNAGARMARAQRIAFCDSDDVVCPDWVRAMSDGLERYDGVGGALDERSLNGEDPPVYEIAKNSLPTGLDFLPYPIGANCGVRYEAWEKLNGFDEGFLHGAEEVDFFWRLQLAGYSLGFVPDAIVAYRHPHSLRTTVRRSFRYGIGSCQLAAAHREHIPRESWFKITGGWLGLFIRLPLIAWPERRHYIRRLAHSAGLVVGSHRYKVLHLAPT